MTTEKSNQQAVRIGIVGAGQNTRVRHIPGFRAIDGVEIVGVVNRSAESTARVAAEFDIPKTYAKWEDLVADPDIDAVLVGTWPYLHCDVTCKALESGKHVLTEARMACDAVQAHQMLQSSVDHPELVAQIVPSPFGLVHNDFISEVIEKGFIGDLREAVVIGADSTFWDYSQILHWRQDASFSGHNMLMLGIMHESLMRWTPETTRVYAQTTTFEPQRPAANRPGLTDVTVPDSVQVLTQFEGGARGIYHFSGIDLYGPGNQIHLYGSLGTIKVDFTGGKEEILLGRLDDEALKPLEIPVEKQGGWRVEAEFIGAIRGEEKVRLTDFATGVKYMEFTDAVVRSAKQDAPVDLPLTDLA